jgi:integrase
MKDYEKYTLKNGEVRYRKYVSLGTSLGKRKSTRITAPTLKELRRKEAELRAGSGMIKANGSIKFGEAYDLYLADQKEKLSPTTYHQKEWVRKKWKPIEKMSIAKIRAKDIEDLFKIRSEEIGSETLRHEYAMMSAFFKWMLKKKMIDENPMIYMNAPKEIHKEMHYLTEEQFWKLYQATKSDHFKVIFMVLFFCGLRKGEICGLSLDDLHECELVLHHTVKEIFGNLEVSDKFKNETSRRIVPIPRFLKYDLEHQLKLDDYPFKSDYQRIGPALNNALNAAGLPHIRVHDLRHSYAALLISKGVDIYTVSKMMGHATVVTTSKTYGHLYDEKRKAITDLF